MTAPPPSGEGPAAKRSLTVRRGAAGVAIVTGIFSAVIAILLAADAVRARRADPLDLPALERMQQESLKHPEDRRLKEDFRELDLAVRRAYFSGLGFVRTGALLLFANLLLLLVSLQVLASARRTPTVPVGPPGTGDPPRENRLARWMVATVGALLLVGSLTLFFLSREPAGPAPVAAPGPVGDGADGTAAEHPEVAPPAGSWPAFRGPGGSAVAALPEAPLDWDVPAGRNVRWTVRVPKPGNSSPIVCGGRVFLSGADENSLEVFCFDADTGKLLWQKPVLPVAGLPEVGSDTGHAAPTLASDGSRIFAIFSSTDITCFDLSGNSLWTQLVGTPDNTYGYASSLLAGNGKLFVQFDQNGEGMLTAFDTRTGRLVWETPRKADNSWASPVLIGNGARSELVLNANPAVTAYDPETGKELWSVPCMDGSAEVASSPAFAAGRVFAANDGACLVAIRPPGQPGEEPEVLWKTEDDLPDVSSPVACDRFVFVCTGSGTAVCRDVADGRLLWRHQFASGFYASPILVGDRVYALDRDGTMHVFRAGEKFELLGESPLGEAAVATPAFANGAVFIRGAEHLVCIHE